MKICLVNHGLASGGTDSFVLTLASGLVEDGNDVTIAMAVDPDSGKQFKQDEAESLGIKIHKLSDLGGIGAVLRYAKRLYDFLKAEQFDVFHANMDLFNGVNMLIAWMAKVPVRVCHSHNSKSQYEEQSGRHFIVSIYRAIMRNLLWSFSTFRCGCSAQAMDYLYCKRWQCDVHSRVVFNGVNLGTFSPRKIAPVNSAKKS